VRGERELFFYGNKDVECVKQNVGYFLSRKWQIDESKLS
jgi:hypothetical protein